MEQHKIAEDWVTSNYGKPRDWQIIEMQEHNYHAALVKAFEAGAAQAGVSAKHQEGGFDTAMEAEINNLPYTKHVDDGQYNDGQLAGFERGAQWAKGYFKANNPPQTTLSGITWLPFEPHIKGRYLPDDFLIKFDTGEVRRYMEDELPAAIMTHYALFPTDESAPASQVREAGYRNHTRDFDYLGPEAAATINAVYEGAALWQQEYDACRKVLQELVTLKVVKEKEGKTEKYQKLQPLAWEKAIEFLNKYQHYGE